MVVHDGIGVILSNLFLSDHKNIDLTNVVTDVGSLNETSVQMTVTFLLLFSAVLFVLDKRLSVFHPHRVPESHILNIK